MKIQNANIKYNSLGASKEGLLCFVSLSFYPQIILFVRMQGVYRVVPFIWFIN